MTITYNYKTETYADHSQFNDLADFNRNFEMWAADIKKHIPKRQYNFLIALKRFMAKVPGVSTAKYSTVVTAANEKYELPTSRRTAERIMPVLHRFGIVKMYDTKMKRTSLRGANIIIWERYDAEKANALINYFKNGGTDDDNGGNSKGATIASSAKESKSQNGGTLSSTPKALKIKILYTYKGARKTFKSVSGKLSIKNNEPIAEPVVATANPLKFVSRLKAVIYKSLLNTKKNATEIVSMVYAKINHLTKPAPMRKHRNSLLERSLRIVEACLTAHKNGQLANIKNMRSFINTRLENEMQAFNELQIESALKELEEPGVDIAQVYSDALNGDGVRRKVPDVGDIAPFYDWS